MHKTGETMNYWIFNMSSGEDETSAEAHVLARAYRAAWRAKFGAEPEGSHQFPALGFVVHYGEWAPAWVRAVHDATGPAATAGGTPLVRTARRDER